MLSLDDSHSTFLYKTPADQDPAYLSPLLVRFDDSIAAPPTLIAEVWGQSCAIALASESSLEDVRRHLSALLRVRMDDGPERLYFRYYDPRVLRIFLPTCTPDQLQELFGPVEAMWIEDEDPSVCLEFTLVHSRLHIQRLGVDLRAPESAPWYARRGVSL